MDINIHYSRLNKPLSTFKEGYVNENKIRLKTFSVIPANTRKKLANKWQQTDLIHKSQQPYSVTKYCFFREFFDILEYKQENSEILGYYCDIVTPLEKKGKNYFMTDLLLDLWITSTGKLIELDMDEFETTCIDRIIPEALIDNARKSFQRVRREAESGLFPQLYID